MPALPRVGSTIVDVRNLADIHIRAMTSPAAAGERLIAAGDFLWFKDVAQVLRDQLGQRAAKVPRAVLPDFVVRIGTIFNAELAQLAPSLSVRPDTGTEKADRVLGWRTRPATATIIDTARSLIDKGLSDRKVIGRCSASTPAMPTRHWRCSWTRPTRCFGTWRSLHVKRP